MRAQPPALTFIPSSVTSAIHTVSPSCSWPHPAAVYNNAQTLNLQRFIYLVAQQLQRARRQVGGVQAFDSFRLLRQAAFACLLC